MRLIHSPLHALHDGGMELHRGKLVPCYEMPARVDHILAAIARAGWAVEAPREYDDAVLARVHDEDYLAFVRDAHAQWRAEGGKGFLLAGLSRRAACAATAFRPACMRDLATTPSMPAARSWKARGGRRGRRHTAR